MKVNVGLDLLDVMGLLHEMGVTGVLDLLGVFFLLDALGQTHWPTLWKVSPARDPACHK